MSEAVVDDIVAVLPPLLQSLEALSFIARHLNPPDFGRVMEAAGTPGSGVAGGARAACGLAGGIRAFARAAARPRAMRRWRRSRDLRAVQNGHGDLIAVFQRAAPRPARAGGAVSAGRKTAAGHQLLPRSSVARGRRPAGAAGAAGTRKHRHHPRPQRARQPRRLFALRAGILHARSRLAAGDGAAWRQRQRPRLSVELAARCAQPWRDPGRADRDRHFKQEYLGADGRRHRHAEPRAHPRLPCGRAGTSTRQKCC